MVVGGGGLLLQRSHLEPTSMAWCGRMQAAARQLMTCQMHWQLRVVLARGDKQWLAAVAVVYPLHVGRSVHTS